MDWERARYLMVEQQIRPWNVTDQKVLQRFLDVKREDFVPAGKRELAFADIELPLGDGRFMLSPKIEGKFLQAAGIKSTDRVLVIGATTGYLVALAAGLAAQVYGVEMDVELAEAANVCLKTAGIRNAVVAQGFELDGLASHAPFDIILACCSAEQVPSVYMEQLTDQGRLLMIVGVEPEMSAVLLEKGGANDAKRLFEYALPRRSKEARHSFVF